MLNKNCFINLAAAAILFLPSASRAGVLNIDFNGSRTGDDAGPTYKGVGAAGGGEVWNGLIADSRLEDGSDDDNLTVSGTNLSDDSGVTTVAGFSVGPVGGDVCCAPPVADETDPLALFNEYIFNNSAGNSAGESDFSINGLGASDKADLYFYIRSGAVTIPGITGERLAEDNGIYTMANTMVFRSVPISNGTIQGTVGGGTAVIYGLSISTSLPLPKAGHPKVVSVSPTGNAVRTTAQITVELQDSDIAVATNTVQLFVNDAAVVPEIGHIAGTNITRVTYSPSSGLPESTNHIRIVFGENGSASSLQTNDFSFFVINDADASLVLNIDLNGFRPGDAEGATYSGNGAAGGGAIFNGLDADSTQDDDNLTVAGENLLNSIGTPTVTGFSISPVGGDNNGAGIDPLPAAALFGDYVFVASAGQTTGTSSFTISNLGSVPAVDLYFYFGITPDVEIPGAKAASFSGSAPFTSGNTLYFRSVPVANGSITGVFGKGQTALLYGLSIRKPAPGPFVESTFPAGAGVLDDTPIKLQLLDYVTKVQTNSIQVSVNGGAVVPIITQPGGTNLTMVEYQSASLPEGSNRVQLVFADSSSPAVLRTNEFSFTVVSRARAKTVINIDFNGSRNIPGPDLPGPTYRGQSAAGGGQIWNGVSADSRLEDGTDDDNLTVAATNLVNSLGEASGLSFTVSPMGGDVGGAPTTDPTAQGALFSDYIFNNSAGNVAGESPYEISGIGDAPFVDLYYYQTSGSISLPGVTQGAFSPIGIFSTANTKYFPHVPVIDGSIQGTFGPGLTVIEGMSIALPLPRPFVKSTSPSGGGIPGDTAIVVEVQDYVSQVKSDSIQLYLNGQPVTASASKPSGASVTTVRFQPNQQLPAGSTNRVTVVFSDTSAAPAVQTNEFSFVVLDEVQAAKTVNIDFNGARNVPGPDPSGSTYFGQSAASGGFIWNGIAVDSRLEDGTDDDDLTIQADNLTNSIGGATTISFTLTDVAGDNGGGPAPGTNTSAALFDDYLFNNSAANLAGESPFAISGLGDAKTVDLFFYRGGGNVKVTNGTSIAFSPSGIFNTGNTLYFKDVPVTDGTVNGVFGTGTTVIYGLSIRIPAANQTASPISIGRQAGVIAITWGGSATLQTASSIGGGWADVPGASSPYTPVQTQPAQFYRLKY